MHACSIHMHAFRIHIHTQIHTHKRFWEIQGRRLRQCFHSCMCLDHTLHELGHIGLAEILKSQRDRQFTWAASPEADFEKAIFHLSEVSIYSSRMHFILHITNT